MSSAFLLVLISPLIGAEQWAGSTLEANELEKLVGELSKDPEDAELIRGAMAKVGADEVSDLLGHFGVFQAGNGGLRGFVQSETMVVASRTKDLPVLAAAPPPRKGVRLKAQALCLAGDTDMDEALSVFRHELVHFVHRDVLEEPDLAMIGSDEEYFIQTLLLEGDEVDAHLKQIRGDLRRLGTKAPTYRRFRDMVDSSGNLRVPRRLLAKRLLREGYLGQARQALVNSFENKLFRARGGDRSAMVEVDRMCDFSRTLASRCPSRSI